jgi:hypothetical protein
MGRDEPHRSIRRQELFHMVRCRTRCVTERAAPDFGQTSLT